MQLIEITARRHQAQDKLVHQFVSLPFGEFGNEPLSEKGNNSLI
jgi:hypothetical protein